MAQDQVPVQAINIGDIFHDFLWVTIKDLVLSRLILMLPFLGWGPIGLLTSFVLGIVMGWVYDSMKMVIDLQVIAFKNEGFKRAYDTASVELKIIASQKGVNSAEFIAARDIHKAALLKLVDFNS